MSNVQTDLRDGNDIFHVKSEPKNHLKKNTHHQKQQEHENQIPKVAEVLQIFLRKENAQNDIEKKTKSHPSPLIEGESGKHTENEGQAHGNRQCFPNSGFEVD